MQLSLPIRQLAPVEGTTQPTPAGRIYCNRSLRMDQVELVGFDMDYTLAVYNQPEIDRLSIEATARKLVERGYPEFLLETQYRTDFPIRGLLIDRKLGNVLKMDRYKYVKKAFHGMRELPNEERRKAYHTRRLRPKSKRYHWVDTLYGLSEVVMFAAVVEALDARGGRSDYEELFNDIRSCIDEAHRDGSILDIIAEDLPRYVHRDPSIGDTFHKLRSAGKRLFLLTNSYPEYTERMMSYLMDECMPEYESWKNYFDVIVTAATKPRFFTEKSPFVRADDRTSETPVDRFARGEIYMHGNIHDFERMVGAEGDRVLYVGDHIYGDVLRAKKDSAWRTVMIIQEMDQELQALDSTREQIARMDDLDELRDKALDELREHQFRLKAVQRQLDEAAGRGEPVPTGPKAMQVRHRRAIDRLRARLRAVEGEFLELEQRVDQAFHPFWGSLLKAGAEVSSFGDQVEEYACLYTTRVSNLKRYSPMHYYRSPRDSMPHELRTASI